MDKWEINGISFTVDITDADFMERIETAYKKMSENENKIPKNGRISDIIRAVCGMYLTFFSNLFGDNAGEKIFKNTPTSIAEYENVYLDFLDFVSKQGESRVRRKNEIVSKFRPNKPKFYKKHK